MHRTAVFVDAGYLFAAGSLLIAHEKLPRGELQLDHDALLGLLGRLAGELTGLPLLRIYWYDGAASMPTPQQLAIAYLPNVKLRLGSANQQGQQKGVDSLVVTDLITLARNGAMADAVLLTGDADIRIGVQQAQELGVRVHLLGIAPARDNQSGVLVQEADTVREITSAEVQSFLSRGGAGGSMRPSHVSGSGFLPVPASLSPLALDGIAQRLARDLSVDERAAVHADSIVGPVPAHIDRRLLLAATQAADSAPLTPDQKRRLRVAFVEACRAPDPDAAPC